MTKLTAEWVRKAERDWRSAGELARSPEHRHDQVTFSCQQSAEKYVKAVLQEEGLPVPRIHDLLLVVAPLEPRYRAFRSLRRGLDFLSQFAVDTRYPGHTASKRQAAAALRWAGRVRHVVRDILGLDF